MSVGYPSGDMKEGAESRGKLRVGVKSLGVISTLMLVRGLRLEGITET